MPVGIMIGQAGASFAIAASLVAYVLGVRPRVRFHQPVVAVLVTILLWNAGMLLRFGYPGLGELAFCIQYFGVFTLPPCFLFLAARSTRVSAAEERPGAILAALLVPAALFYLAVLTNGSHGQFARRPFTEAAALGPSEWGGPLFWLSVVWGYVYTNAGIAICVGAALRSQDSIDRKRLWLLACGALVPLAVNAVHLVGWLPFSLTPAALAISGMLLVAAILRYRFLEFAPLSASHVIERLQEGLLISDSAGHVTEANPAAERILSLGAEALLGRTLSEIATRLDASGALAASLAESSRDSTLVRQLQTPDGREVELSADRITGRGNELLGCLLVFRDRTEQLRLERLRHQAERLASVGALAAGLAHEINNPLAYVRANLVELHRLWGDEVRPAEKDGDDEPYGWTEVRELVEESLEGVSRISSIVESTRRLARSPEEGRALVDLNAVARDAIQFATFHQNLGVAVETSLAPDLARVCGSADRLGQVVLNLLINAKQVFGPASRGRVRVETAANGDFVELRVHDDGPGVASEDRERIFDPFYTTKEPDQGTGLGLSISYDVVVAHGGVIEVSDSPLGGACFSIRLPAATQEA